MSSKPVFKHARAHTMVMYRHLSMLSPSLSLNTLSPSLYVKYSISLFSEKNEFIFVFSYYFLCPRAPVVYIYISPISIFTSVYTYIYIYIYIYSPLYAELDEEPATNT